jgi:DNA (cytosine-5)-methyltransferase 1
VGEAVGVAVKSFITKSMNQQKQIKYEISPLPSCEKQAVSWLVPLLDLDSRALKELPIKEFKQAWYSISFLFMGLHPDGALEHGTEVSNDNEDYAVISDIDPRLINPFYVQSGWPLVLAQIAKEAWRRYESGQLFDEEFYCSEAQMAGACFRDPELLKVLSDNRQSVA